MRAVAVEALRAETLEFDRLDGKRIGTELSRRRQQYYAARLEDKVGDTDEEIAELLDRPDAKPHANLTRVRQTAGEIILDSPRKHLFPQDDIAAVRNDWTAQVVNRGIISRSLAGQNWQCAIDNLKTYIKTGTHQMDEPFPD